MTTDRGQRALALDIGEARIGVAVSDETGLIATPLTVLPRKGLEQALRALVDQWRPKTIVVGLPASLSGREGPQAKLTRQEADRLMNELPEPPELEFWDERLTTVMADRLLNERGVRGGARKQERDAIAAALILQGWLDSRRFHQR